MKIIVDPVLRNRAASALDDVPLRSEYAHANAHGIDLALGTSFTPELANQARRILVDAARRDAASLRDAHAGLVAISQP